MARRSGTVVSAALQKVGEGDVWEAVNWIHLD
jgi:hypothetical protein